MKLKVVFFASIRETLGVGDVLLDETLADARLATLIDCLAARYGESARQALTAENVRVAVNQELVNGDVQLASGDEVAFFPPVSGG